MRPFDVISHWRGRFGVPAAWYNRAIDRDRLARRLEALLKAHGAPIAYEVFGRRFTLCAPDLPGLAGDPDITLTLGDAVHDLFRVAQEERAAPRDVSAHETLRAALGDFLARALEGPRDIPALIADLLATDRGEG